MNTKLNSIIAFAAGALIGSVVTWKVVKDRYEEIIELMQERELTVADVIEAGGEVILDEEEEEENTHNALDDMRATYNSIAQEAGYVDEKEEMTVPGPYVISPEDFAELDGYRTESLWHYADNVLTDDENNILDDPEAIIGDINPVDHYGEYEQDSVFVRNDVTKCDYEILRDTRKFHEAYPEE